MAPTQRSLASRSLSAMVIVNKGDGGEPTAPIIVIDHGDGGHCRLRRQSIAASVMAVFVDDGRHWWRRQWDGADSTVPIVVVDGNGKDAIAAAAINCRCRRRWPPSPPSMRNDVQWILVVVVNCAEELMVIVDGGDSGRRRLQWRGARVTQAKARRGPEVEGKRVRADKGARARVRVDMADDNGS
jgi:hypothetical protein